MLRRCNTCVTAQQSYPSRITVTSTIRLLIQLQVHSLSYHELAALLDDERLSTPSHPAEFALVHMWQQRAKSTVSVQRPAFATPSMMTGVDVAVSPAAQHDRIERLSESIMYFSRRHCWRLPPSASEWCSVDDRICS